MEVKNAVGKHIHMSRDDFDLGRSDVECSSRLTETVSHGSMPPARSNATGIFTSLLAFYTLAVFVVTASYETVNSMCNTNAIDDELTTPNCGKVARERDLRASFYCYMLSHIKSGNACTCHN